jgi:hypothetical protein
LIFREKRFAAAANTTAALTTAAAFSEALAPARLLHKEHERAGGSPHG